jgi:hypothetical protein
MYSDEQLSAALAGAAEFIRHATSLPYRVAAFPPEFIPVDARIELPLAE